MLFRAAIATFALLTTCAVAATPRDALVVAWNLDALITLDPAQIGEVTGNGIVGSVCDPLVRVDPTDTSRLIPATAERWVTSPDGLTLTFTLRDDLRFPSGKKATAEDAVWSMQRAVLLGYGNSANLTQWGFTQDRIAEQIKAADDRTIVVSLDRPYPPNLILAAAFVSNVSYILSKEEGTKNAKIVDGRSDYGNGYFKTNPVCVGPYRVSRWDANDVVVLERNDTYYGPKPNSRRVIIRHVPESSGERLLLEKGDIDVARVLNTDDLHAMAANPDIHIEQTLVQDMTYFAFNTSDPILSNPKVRLAFRYLIDYDGLGQTVLAYLGVPRASLVPEGAFGALDRKAGQPFKLDVDKARALLAEAGYPNGFTKKLILSANNIAPAVAQHFQANAARVGVKLDLEQMADAKLFTRARARDFDIALIGWGAGYLDADSMVSRHAVNPDNRFEAKLTQYPVWRSAWRDEGINARADQARMERDPARRIEMYKDIQDYMMMNGPMAYIYQSIRTIAYRASIKDFAIGPTRVDVGSARK